MKALKVSYALAFMVCSIQLMFWLFSPFIGGVLMWDMVTGNGFYISSSAEKIEALSLNWGVSVSTLKTVNQLISIVYFASLILTVISILFLKKISKRLIYITAICLLITNLCILFNLWLQKGLPQNERLIQLNKVAVTQMKSLVENKAVKKLK